jgi:nucleoid DNA-binding protein
VGYSLALERKSQGFNNNQIGCKMGTYKDLVRAVGDASGQTQVVVNDVLRLTFSIIPRIAGEKGLRLGRMGFGTFKMVTRHARAGRNPQTGEPIQIAESTRLAFKAVKTK